MKAKCFEGCFWFFIYKNKEGELVGRNGQFMPIYSH